MARPTNPKPTDDKPEHAKPEKAKSGRATPKSTGRYTPPIPQTHKVSSKWVPAIMFTALGLGMLTILANYVDLLPGDGPNNSYLLIGLGFITVGFITATKYH